MKNNGFTLAEVLITLGIIGVVAAMTMPAIIRKQQKIATVTRLKKSYSIINQAFKMAEAKNGPIESWAEWNDAEVILDKYIIPEIRGSKKYGKAVIDRLALCYDPNSKLHGVDIQSQYVWMSGVFIATPFIKGKTASFKLPDGSCIGLNPFYEYIDTNGNLDKRFAYNIFVDINNVKGPNVAGEDLFFFVVDKNVIKPYGYNLSDEFVSGASKGNSCNRKAPVSGYTCAARIMRDGWKIKY